MTGLASILERKYLSSLSLATVFDIIAVDYPVLSDPRLPLPQLTLTPSSAARLRILLETSPHLFASVGIAIAIAFSVVGAAWSVHIPLPEPHQCRHRRTKSKLLFKPIRIHMCTKP